MLNEIVSNPNGAMRSLAYPLVAQCYKQLNASVGRFATSTLIADTTALESGTAGNDSVFTSVEARLQSLLKDRDTLATQMKGSLNAAAFTNKAIPLGTAVFEVVRCNVLLARADRLT